MTGKVRRFCAAWLKRARTNNAVMLQSAYALMLVLLAVSGYQVYRLERLHTQTRFSVYEKFLAQSEARTALRRALWWASNTARDYFLSHDANRQLEFRHTLDEISQEAERAIAAIERLDREQTERLAITGKVRDYLRGITMLKHPLDSSAPEGPRQLYRLSPLRLQAMTALDESAPGNRKKTRTAISTKLREHALAPIARC